MIVDGTHVDLEGSAFSGSYTSGGSLVPNGTVGLTLAGSAVQIQANGITPAPWRQSQVVAQGDLRAAHGSTYICVQSGTTASSGTGPTGTANGQGDGSASWDYVGAGATVSIQWQVCKLEVFSN